ncbi:hypothetical protein ACFFGH_34345 [Lysobacter korlensis]|uniref:Uncharacterized protein n=1 Tax=Lysobacter korlensis TaxID=553636 RepID=A0ABV6S133_9GAMM
METSATLPPFPEVAEFVRSFAGLGSAREINPQTRLDADPRITGLDGQEMLQEAAARFSSRLCGPDGYITTFGLKPNECLFSSEGLDLLGIGALIARLTGESRHTVRDLTVGELHAAICRHRLASKGAA